MVNKIRSKIRNISYFIYQNRVIDFLILFLIVILIYHGWFRPGTIARSDLFLPSKAWLRDHLSLPYLWSNEHGGFSNGVWQIAQHPLHFFWAFLVNYFNVDIDLALRIIWCFPFLVLSIASMYYLSHIMFRSRIISFISSCFFVSNSVIISQVEGGYLAAGVSTALIPLTLAFFIKSLQANYLRNSLMSGLLLGITVFYDMKIASISLIIVISFFIYNLLIKIFYLPIKRSEIAIQLIKSLRCLIIILIVTILLNFFWILPSIFINNTGAPTSAKQPAYINVRSYDPLLYSILLSPKSRVQDYQIFMPAVYIITSVVFLAFVLRPKDKYVLYLTSLSLIFIFFSKGGFPPFKNIYYWSYTHIPGFIAFRSSEKFLITQGIFYALLLGVSTDSIVSRLCGKIKNIKVNFLVNKYNIVSFVVLLILAAISPGLIGPHSHSHPNRLGGSTLNPKSIASEYRKLNAWIQKETPDFRFLIFPAKAAHISDDQSHPGVYPDLPQGFLDDFSCYFFMKHFQHKGVLSRKQTVNFGRIIGLLNIKNLILLPSSMPEYNWSMSEKYAAIKEALDYQRELKKIIQFNDLCIYENKSVLPRIYLPSNKSLIVGGRSILLPLSLFGIDFSKFALFFVGQLKNESLHIWDYLNNIIFYEKDVDDLILSTVDNSFRINLWQYAKFARDGRPTEQRSYDEWYETENYWLRYFNQYWVSRYGEIAESPNGLIQAGYVGARIDIPYIAKDSEEYDIWLRLGLGHGNLALGEMGGLSFLVDYHFLVRTLSSYSEDRVGLRWIKLGTLYLEQGKHTLTIINQKGINTLDEIVIIPQKTLVAHSDKIISLLSPKSQMYIKEAEMSLVPQKGKWTFTEKWSGDASGEGTFTTNDNFASCYTYYTILNEGRYRLSIRVGRDKFYGKLKIELDGDQELLIKLPSRKLGEGLIWLETEPIFFKKGKHKITISKIGKGTLDLDILLLHNGNSNIDELFVSNDTTAFLFWRMINPSKYEVSLNNNKPEILILANGYNSLWSAKINGKEVKSIITNSVVNSFFIKETGEKKLIIEYGPQKYVVKGTYITIIGITLFIFCLTIFKLLSIF